MRRKICLQLTNHVPGCPILCESQHLSLWGYHWHDTLLTWAMESKRCFPHSRDKSSCGERIWEIWESYQEQRSVVEHVLNTTTQLLWYCYGVEVSITLVKSWPIEPIASYSTLVSLQVKILVSVFCSYSNKYITVFRLPRLHQWQIEIFISAYLHAAYEVSLWGRARRDADSNKTQWM